MLSTDRKYTPKTRPLDDDPDFWEEALENGLGDWLEVDLYEFTRTLVERLISERPGPAMQTSQTLRGIAMSGMSAQLVRFFLWLKESSLVDGKQCMRE